jgi:DNA polymerase-3 subunit delta'
MSDIDPLLTDITQTPEWAELSAMISSRGAPHALAAILPAEFQRAFRDAYARTVLCESGTGADNCASCGSWGEDGHPDMVIAGDEVSAPGVSDCLALQSKMYLKPVAAPGRLGVVPSAEGLSPPASNSLLKLAEEPPEGSRLLFLASEDNLMPTIRSRVWMFRFTPEPDPRPASPPPETPLEWAEWLGRTKKFSLDELAAETGAWIKFLSARGDWRMAASLTNVMYLSKKRYMPVSMVQDALIALLREGVRSEQIFGNLRET